ncbi:SDR family oxidoreductase [Barrientosiimonas marina]|uniref:SDR family oxidoreductase n=1 Tax=Lentibacillus kimchii TaxID=1542911 RepID=A0ABW2UTH8_9BACI
MKRLDQYVCVISGAATGIGRASAKRFADEGAMVLCADRDEETVQKTAQEIRDSGGEAEAYYVDVSEEESVKALTEKVKQKHARIDVLFNNAGIDRDGGKVHEYPVEAFDAIINIDLRGTFLMSKYMIPLMLDRGGSIINTSSMSGSEADFERVGYNAAKGGVNNLTKATAFDYARQGIRANAIAPGTIETPLVDKMAGTEENEGGKTFRDAQKWVTPMGRLGKPEEMASIALFLASSDSSFVTGEIITGDGGLTAYTWPAEMLFEKGWKDTTD